MVYLNKKKSFILLAIFSLLFLASIVYAEVSSTDKTEIQNQITMIANSVNNNDINSIINIDIIPSLSNSLSK